MQKRMKRQDGQVGLIVLLIAAVILTVGISVAQRGVSETRYTAETEEQTQALNVAEAGIEDVLDDLDTISYGVDVDIAVGGGKTARVQINPDSSLTDVVVASGHSIEYDLTGSGSGDGIEIGWNGGNPAFVVTVINDDGTRVQREAHDPSNRANGFTFPVSNPFTVNIGFNSAVMARVKVLYSQTEVSIGPAGGWSPGTQFYTINSEALDVGTSNITVQTTKTLPQLPSIFDYVLFSGTGLEKTP